MLIASLTCREASRIGQVIRGLTMIKFEAVDLRPSADGERLFAFGSTPALALAQLFDELVVRSEAPRNRVAKGRLP